jgi:galactonate dehydratase
VSSRRTMGRGRREEPIMKMDRRVFTKSLAAAAAALALPSWPTKGLAAKLPVNRVTKIRCYYPPNYQSNGPQAFPQSNMVVLVDTEAGITGIGQGGSPDTVRNMARSVIGKNAFDTEFIWQHGFMDGFYSPGKERLHALGAIDLALWDIKGKALQTPVYELFGGKARQHIELYATNGVPQGLIPQNELQRMSLKAAMPQHGFAKASVRMATG